MVKIGEFYKWWKMEESSMFSILDKGDKDDYQAGLMMWEIEPKFLWVACIKCIL